MRGRNGDGGRRSAPERGEGYSGTKRCGTQSGRFPGGELSDDADRSVWAYQVGPSVHGLCELLEDVDGAGVCEVHGRALAYREMDDGMASFEGVAESDGVEVVRGTAVEGEVDVLHIVAECEYGGTVVPDGGEEEAANGRSQGGVVCEGVECAGGLVGCVEVYGVVKKR